MKNNPYFWRKNYIEVDKRLLFDCDQDSYIFVESTKQKYVIVNNLVAKIFSIFEQ